MIKDLEVFEDKIDLDSWRVEWNDEDGDCYVTVFHGPNAEARSRHYYSIISSWRLAFKLEGK